MRICPACYLVVPACTSRCTSCWSQFISCGKYQRNVQREAPSEIPSSSIAQTMEAATAAVPTIDVDENENADTATIAKPEMEVDAPPSEAEQEPDEEMFNEVPDLEEEEEYAGPDEERRPLILPGRTLITDPDLMQARSAMQPSYYPEKRIGRCNDAMRTAFACFGRTMYKVWPTTSSWMTMPCFQMQEKFEQGCRYDVLGNWPGKLSELDHESKISRDVTDEAILEFARAKAEPDDPDGAYMLRRFRANQILSSLVRGSIQMGYSRDTFNPETYIKRGQSTKEMHLSCLCVLSEIIPKLTGYESFSLIRPPPTEPTEFLNIDPVGIVMMQSLKDASADTIALLIDHNIQVPAKMTDKVVKRKIDKEKNPQAHKGRQALKHPTPADYMAAGQTSIMDASITPEQRERLGRPSNVKVHHPVEETPDVYLGMPTRTSTKVRRERQGQNPGRDGRST